MFRIICSCILIILIVSCKNKNQNQKKISQEQQQAIDALILEDTSVTNIPLMQQRLNIIKQALSSPKPIILLTNLDERGQLAQKLVLTDNVFCKNLFDKTTKQPYLNEIFNVYEARPQELTANTNGIVYKIEMYNYALNLTTTALVNITSKTILSVTNLAATQPDIPTHLKDLALQIAVHNNEVIKALGYKPNEHEALMANTKTALNNTKCERSLHLCVAPTFIKNDKALWAIVDLTDCKIVGIRWTNVGNTAQPTRISERKLKFDKIMECYCKQMNSIEKDKWKLNYILTTSDGLRISEVFYNNKQVINNAKIVDWHVGYSNTDGFGYSDAVGCPEFSQAAVVAVSDPRIVDIEDNGKLIGFALEQNFSSEQWPLPCNYNYLQRFEFYNDGRFRAAGASLGRGCGNDGTYRPVFRIAFTGNSQTFAQYSNNSWTTWQKEQWHLTTPTTLYSKEGYLFKLNTNANEGFYIETNRGQFKDGSRGDNPYVFVTKQHFDKDEGEKDLVTIGPCCNTDYKQGPEKFIEPNPENIVNTDLVIWYVPQMKNDNTKGKEYCWAESVLVNGVYKTKYYPCMGGAMFVPF